MTKRDDRGEEIDDEQLAMDRVMRGLAEMVQRELIRSGLPKEQVGFGIFVFGFTQTPADLMGGQRLSWISSARRPDMIDALREWIRVQEGQGNTGQTARN